MAPEDFTAPPGASPFFLMISLLAASVLIWNRILQASSVCICFRFSFPSCTLLKLGKARELKILAFSRRKCRLSMEPIHPLGSLAGAFAAAPEDQG